jgi:site-specific DNA recombinase
VPAIIDEATQLAAQAQLARNAALSFRNNTKYRYLLRCLLTCGSCSLAIFGTTYRATERQPERRYYKCAGKDPIFSGRGRICTRRTITGEELEAAIWEHVVGLLNEPERLLAQFPQQARLATEGAEAERLATRLERLDREERRLVDAYQAEVIALEELAERRQLVAQRRQALAEQRAQHERLRRERAHAQAVLTDLTAFCGRVRGRLAAATFDDKQAILQLLIERIIVHNDRLEVRHVIPLCSAPDGPTAPGPPDVRLRSDGVHPAALPARPLQDGGDRPHQPAVRVADHQPHPRQPARHQPAQELLPAGPLLARSDASPNTARSPVIDTPVARTTAIEMIRPCWRTVR